MVVLSAAVLTTGKTLIARQFVEMTRLRVEGLMSAFSKLVESGPGRDHTFIETENVRYVYQPMESLYMVLITNKSSNILEDLETLRLLAKVTQDCCNPQVTEESVTQHAFDIVFSFDEVISNGYRESVTLPQIKTYTEMDSHEEKLHQMMEQSKMNEAREQAKKKQMELAKQRALAGKDGPAMTGFGSDGTGASTPGDSGTAGFGSNNGMPSIGSNNGMGISAIPGTGMMESLPSGPAASFEVNSAATIKSSAPTRGLQLGKKKPESDMLKALGIKEPERKVEEAAMPQEVAPATAFNPLMDPVLVEIEEKITADLQVEGGLEGDAVCNGTFQTTVLDASKADLVCFKLAPQDQNFKYKVHPNLNKASHANNILEVRDVTKAFRANTPVPLVKYQFKSSDDAFLPVNISCWPTTTSDGTQVVVELELTDSSMTLEDVVMRFGAAPHANPTVASASPGEANYDAGRQQVIWHIPVLDNGDGCGSMEFTAAVDVDSLLPFTCEAVRRGQTKCPLDILECYHQTSKEAIAFTCNKTSIYQLKIGG